MRVSSFRPDQLLGGDRMLGVVTPSNTPAGGDLTLLIPLGVFILAVFMGFLQRRRIH